MTQIYPLNSFNFFFAYPSKLIDLLDNRFKLETRIYHSASPSSLEQGIWERGIEINFSIMICGLGFSYQKHIDIGTEPAVDDDSIEENDIEFFNRYKARKALMAISSRNWKNGCVTELAQTVLDDGDIEPLIEPKYWNEISLPDSNRQ